MKNKLKLELVEGESICNECNGVGYYKYHEEAQEYRWCEKCKGTGKLTWIEEILGKQVLDFRKEI